MRDERLGVPAAIERLQEPASRLREIPCVSRSRADGGHDPRTCESERELAGLLVRKQVEIALTIALLDVGEAVERVRERRADLRESSSSSSTISDGSPRRDFVGLPVTPTTSPRCDVDLARARLRARGAGCGRVRSTRSRNTSLPMSRRAMHAAGEAPRLGALLARLERSRPRRGRAAISSRSGNRFGVSLTASLTIAQAWGPLSGVRSLPHDLEPVPVRRTARFDLAVRQQHRRDSLAALRRSSPGWSSAEPMPCRCADGSTPIPARYQCASGHRLGAQRLHRAAVGEKRPERGAAGASGVATSARSVGPMRIAARPGGSHRAAPSTGPAVAHTSAAVTSKPTRKSHGSSRARRSASPTRDQSRPHAPASSLEPRPSRERRLHACDLSAQLRRSTSERRGATRAAPERLHASRARTRRGACRQAAFDLQDLELRARRAAR